MNAFINQQKAVLRLRKNRRLLNCKLNILQIERNNGKFSQFEIVEQQKLKNCNTQLHDSWW